MNSRANLCFQMFEEDQSYVQQSEIEPLPLPKEEIQDKTMHLPFSDQTQDFVHYYSNSKFSIIPNPQSSEEEPLYNNNQPQAMEQQQKTFQANSRKGLKNLSMSVYGIVSALQTTNYKEVATQLLKKMSINGPPICIKDQCNIKRRVYDALNILIAAGLLRKDRKYVHCQIPLSQFIVGKKNERKQEEKNSIEMEIEELKAKLLQRKEKLWQIEERKKLVKCLMNRNAVEHKKEQEYLRFPLIGLVLKQNTKMLFGEGNNCNLWKFDQRFESLHGDVDILYNLKRENIEIDCILQGI